MAITIPLRCSHQWQSVVVETRRRLHDQGEKALDITAVTLVNHRSKCKLTWAHEITKLLSLKYLSLVSSQNRDTTASPRNYCCLQSTKHLLSATITDGSGAAPPLVPTKNHHSAKPTNPSRSTHHCFPQCHSLGHRYSLSAEMDRAFQLPDPRERLDVSRSRMLPDTLLLCILFLTPRASAPEVPALQ